MGKRNVDEGAKPTSKANVRRLLSVEVDCAAGLTENYGHENDGH